MKTKAVLTPILIWVLGIVLMDSCNINNKEEENLVASAEKVLRVDPNKTSEPYFFDHFSSVDIIPLETNVESIINYVNKIVLFKGIFYILDSKQATLFLFEENGKYINKISRKGKGPGELTEVYDFNINKFTGNIELLDPWGKIFIFSPLLEYIESIVIDQKVVHQFYNMNQDTIVFYASSEEKKLSFFTRSTNQIFLKDLEFKSVDKINLYPKSNYNNAFIEYDGKLLFTVPYSNIIYNITDAKIEPYITWDFGKYNFNAGKIGKEGDELYHIAFYKNLKDQVINLSYYYETGNFIFTRFLFNGLFHSLIYNKSNMEYEVVKSYKEGIYGVDIYTEIIENEFYRVMNLDEKSVGRYHSIFSEDQAEIIQKNKPEDNPGILKYRIKDYAF